MSYARIFALTCVAVCLHSRAVAFVALTGSSRTRLATPRSNGRGPSNVSSGSAHMLAKGFGSKPSKPKQAAHRIVPASKPCPCFSGKPYGECCKPFHEGKKLPEPVDVMRARYSAYACGNAQFIMNSTHPTHEEYGKAGWRDEIEAFCKQYRFTGLETNSPEEDPDVPNKTYVYFTAMMAGVNGAGAVSFDERSIFLKENDQWLYLSPDKDYVASVDVVSNRKYNRKARTDTPKGLSSTT